MIRRLRRLHRLNIMIMKIGGRWYIMKLCQIFAYNFSDLGLVGRRTLQDFFNAIAHGALEAGWLKMIWMVNTGWMDD